MRVLYPSVFERFYDYLKEGVLLEFGGRNITDPCTEFDIEPDIAGLFEDVDFPEARPHVLNVERTFWEKLTAIHFECNRKEFRTGTNRLSRHGYDVCQLLNSGVGTQALGNVDLLKSVVEHKNAFYYSGSADYEACLRGEFRLFPGDLTPLESDYEAMSQSGMFYGKHPSFDEIHDTLERFGEDLRERLS